MAFLLALAVGVLFSAGILMMTRRSMLKLVLGISLLGYGANLLIFTVGRLTRAHPPIIPDNATQLTQPYADPVPQALILTAIVIGFGVQAFLLVLLKRTYEAVGSPDIDEMRSTDMLD